MNICEVNFLNLDIFSHLCYNLGVNTRRGYTGESDKTMDWGEIIQNLFFDLILTVFVYLLVPVIFCIRKKTMTQKQIKTVVIINGVCVCLLCGIIAGRVSGAVFLWSWVSKKIMEKVLLVDEGDEHIEENQ